MSPSQNSAVISSGSPRTVTDRKKAEHVTLLNDALGDVYSVNSTEVALLSTADEISILLHSCSFLSHTYKCARRVPTPQATSAFHLKLRAHSQIRQIKQPVQFFSLSVHRTYTHTHTCHKEVAQGDQVILLQKDCRSLQVDSRAGAKNSIHLKGSFAVVFFSTVGAITFCV